jgi:subtilisin family serine protease
METTVQEGSSIVRLSSLLAAATSAALALTPIAGATATTTTTTARPTAAPPAPSKPPRTSSITLITGDQVRVVQQEGRPDQVTFVAGRGLEARPDRQGREGRSARHRHRCEPPRSDRAMAAAQNFSNSPEVTDRAGHGTHVAGILAGTGAASGGKYRGVAPDASLLNGKVLDDSGSGTESSVIAGMEWATAQGAKVVNLSLGAGPTDGTDPVSQAVNTLSAQTGALFVVAAGNSFFPWPESVSSPASADAALAVGNLARDGSLSRTSCVGPRMGDRALKPEISAPGEQIVAPRAAGTSLGEPVDDNYTSSLTQQITHAYTLTP